MLVMTMYKYLFDRILSGNYKQEDIKWVREMGIYALYENIRGEFGDGNAYDILQKILDTANMPYSKCEMTGKPIAFIIKRQYFEETGLIDRYFNERSQYIVKNVEYICPHCNKVINANNDEEIFKMIRGEKENKTNNILEYNIDIRNHKNYKIDIDKLYNTLKQQISNLYMETLKSIKNTRNISVSHIENFKIEVLMFDDNVAMLIGYGEANGDSFRYSIATYENGEVTY